jgi:hypothetical protein
VMTTFAPCRPTPCSSSSSTRSGGSCVAVAAAGSKAGSELHAFNTPKMSDLPSCLLISSPMPELPPVTSATWRTGGCRVSNSSSTQAAPPRQVMPSMKHEIQHTFPDKASDRKGDDAMTEAGLWTGHQITCEVLLFCFDH